MSKDNLTHIVDILTESLRSRLSARCLGLEITDEAKKLIIERGYDPVYGARPLKRYLQASVETLIARAIIGGDMQAGHTVVIDAENGELICK